MPDTKEPYLSYPQLRRRGWTRAEILRLRPDITADLFHGPDENEPGKIEHYYHRETIEQLEQQPGWLPTRPRGLK